MSIHELSPFEKKLLDLAGMVRLGRLDLDREMPQGLEAELRSQAFATPLRSDMWHINRAVFLTRSQRLLHVLPDQEKSSFSLRPAEWQDALIWADDDYLGLAQQKGLSLSDGGERLCDALDEGRPVRQAVLAAFKGSVRSSVSGVPRYLDRLQGHPDLLEEVLDFQFQANPQGYLGDMEHLGSSARDFEFALMWRAAPQADIEYLLDMGNLWDRALALAQLRSNHQRVMAEARLGTIRDMIAKRAAVEAYLDEIAAQAE